MELAFFLPKFSPSLTVLEKLFYYQSYNSGRREYKMASQLSIATKNRTFLMFSIFYIVAGLAQLASFAIEGSSAPLHLPILGVISLITGYLVFSSNKWAVPLVVGLLAVGLTFGATTLSSSIALNGFGGAMLLHIALIVYLILLLVVSIYLLSKRETLN